MEYISYLDTLAQERPVLLLAHLYTQESALLAGGQMIRYMQCCDPWHTSFLA